MDVNSNPYPPGLLVIEQGLLRAEPFHAAHIQAAANHNQLAERIETKRDIGGIAVLSSLCLIAGSVAWTMIHPEHRGDEAIDAIQTWSMIVLPFGVGVWGEGLMRARHQRKLARRALDTPPTFPGRE